MTKYLLCIFIRNIKFVFLTLWPGRLCSNDNDKNDDDFFLIMT